MEQDTIVQNYGGIRDPASILEAIDPQKDVDDIVYRILGLERRYSVEGSKTKMYIKRVNKPDFTDEYARQLGNDLKSFLNYTIQVSRFTDEVINRQVGNFLLELLNDLCTHGDDHYISDATWKRVLQIHDSKFIDENQREQSGWYKFGIEWNYDKPITNDMISLVKNSDEEVDQSIKFGKILKEFGAIILASFNKSYSSNGEQLGMVLQALGEMRQERIAVREQPQENKGGFLGFGNKKGNPKIDDQRWQ